MAKGREEWLRDIRNRQRNIVFPDTAVNEGRFWRNLYEGKQRLTPLQFAGILVFGICVLGLVVGIFLEPNGGSFSENILIALIRYAIAFGILGGFLLVFGIVQRLQQRHSTKPKVSVNRSSNDAEHGPHTS
jgi:hypothetical protein